MNAMIIAEGQPNSVFFVLKDFGGHGTAFKFASLFDGTEQTEVHGTEIFAGSTLTRLCDGVWPPRP